MGSSRIAPKARWTVTGDLRDAHKAIDGEVSTIAFSEASHANAAITIDLGKVCLFNTVTIEHGAKEFGYCRKLAILTSDKGRTFQPQILVPGLRRVTTAVLVKQVLTRYVRIQVVEPGNRPWAVAEIYLD